MTRLLPAVALALASTPALAGGFSPVQVAPAPAAPVVPVAPVGSSDWSGPYVGGQFGYGSLASEDEETGEYSEDYTGATYGLHAGYLFDFGALVAGGELDFDGSSIETGQVVPPPPPETEDPGVGSILRSKLRLGFDAGRLLPYVTAGVAQLRLDEENAAGDDSFDGRFLGLGASYLISDRLMVGVEALRHSFEETPAEGLSTELDTLSLRGSFRF